MTTGCSGVRSGRKDLSDKPLCPCRECRFSEADVSSSARNNGGPIPYCVIEVSYFVALPHGSFFSLADRRGPEGEAERDNLSRSDIADGETTSPQRWKLDRSHLDRFTFRNPLPIANPSGNLCRFTSSPSLPRPLRSLFLASSLRLRSEE